MNFCTAELKSSVKGCKDRFEAQKLREDISRFMESPQFKQLSQSDKNRVEDLIVEVLAKEEQYKGCDPLRTIFGH
jgi:hypothetical protein